MRRPNSGPRARKSAPSVAAPAPLRPLHRLHSEAEAAAINAMGDPAETFFVRLIAFQKIVALQALFEGLADAEHLAEPGEQATDERQGEHALVSDRFDAMKSQFRQAKEKHHLVVVMASLSLKEASRLPLDDVDVLIIESAYEKEWEILKLPGKITGFLLLHIPIIFLLFYGLIEIEKNSTI